MHHWSMRSHPLGSLDAVLPLPDGPLPKASIAPKLQTVAEAKTWPGGPDKTHQLHRRLYVLDEWELGLGKPGKEASRKKRPNENDMTPTVWRSGREVGVLPASFFDIWAAYESLPESGRREVLTVCGRLLYRNAFLLDHKRESSGLRYRPRADVLDYLAAQPPEASGMRLDVLHHFIELIALNEDVKYSTLSKLSGEAYDLRRVGRVSTLMTTLHFLLVLLGQATTAELVSSISRGKGVTSLSHLDARDRLLACSA